MGVVTGEVSGEDSDTGQTGLSLISTNTLRHRGSEAKKNPKKKPWPFNSLILNILSESFNISMTQMICTQLAINL